MVPNTPLASAPGEEFHPLIFRTLEMHEGQVKIQSGISLSHISILAFVLVFAFFSCLGLENIFLEKNKTIWMSYPKYIYGPIVQDRV